MIVSTVFGPCPASSVVTLQWYHLSCENSETVETDMRSWFSIPSALWMTGGFRDSWSHPCSVEPWTPWGKCKVNCSQEELGRVAAPGPAWYGPVPAWSRSDGPGAAPLSCWYDWGMNEQTDLLHGEPGLHLEDAGMWESRYKGQCWPHQNARTFYNPLWWRQCILYCLSHQVYWLVKKLTQMWAEPGSMT